MKKTEKYQLNQWELSDRVRMEDFNADNLRLEAVLEGKTGRFEQIYRAPALGGGTGSFGMAFQIKDWGQWECVVAIADMGGTEFLPDDYFSLRLQYDGGGSSEAMDEIRKGPLIFVFLPFHDASAKIRGFVTGGGSRALLEDRPFSDLKSFFVSLKNSTLGKFLDESTTVFKDHVWTVYGLR